MRHQASIMPTATLAAALSWILLSSGPAAQHIDCPKFVHDAERVIQTLDSDHDGTLSHEEWLPYEQDMFARFEKSAASRGASFNPNDVTMIFGELDTNHDGKLTLKELTRNLCPLNP